MSKPIIKKEKSEYGSITLSFFNNGDGHHAETMNFDSEEQLSAFSYMLRLMVSTNAESISVE
jgi:hypothetical protein